LIGFGSAVAKAIRRAGQEHINEVTFKHRARLGFDLAQAHDFPASSDRSDVYQVKRPLQGLRLSSEVP